MAKDDQSPYEEALRELRRAHAQATLDDSGSHFPYKREEALAALRGEIDQDTNNHPTHWYTSETIIEATAKYVEAQQALLEAQAAGADDEDVEAARLTERDAARELGEARAQHRRGRPIAPVAVAGNPQDIEETRTMMRNLSKSGHTVDSIARLTGKSLTEVQGALAEMED